LSLCKYRAKNRFILESYTFSVWPEKLDKMKIWKKNRYINSSTKWCNYYYNMLTCFSTQNGFKFNLFFFVYEKEKKMKNPFAIMFFTFYLHSNCLVLLFLTEVLESGRIRTFYWYRLEFKFVSIWSTRKTLPILFFF
jgi:hypothetical protein